MNINFSKKAIRLLPALLIMTAIFAFSARPSDAIPLSLFERILYKGGHVTGYAMLAIAYWRAFEFKNKGQWFAWILAVLYAVTDEFHQSFVPGRHPALFDVVIYDNIGAFFAVWLAGIFIKQKQLDLQNLVVE